MSGNRRDNDESRNRRPRPPRRRNDGDREEVARPPRGTNCDDIIDGNLGIVHLKLASATPRAAYTQLSRLFLAGFDNHGAVLPQSKRVHSVELTALGNAVFSAIFVADNLVKGNVARVVSTVTEFVEGDEDTEESGAAATGTARRSGPRISIILKRVDGWKYQDDAVLARSKVYQNNVLNAAAA